MSSPDPRIKLLWAFLWLMAIFTLQTNSGQLLILSGTLLMIVLSRVTLMKTVRTVRFLLLLLPITFCVHFFFSNPGILSQLKRGTFVIETLGIPLMFTLRMGNLIFFMGFLLNWIAALEFLDAVYIWLRPLRRLRFPVDDFFQIIFIAVKFFPIIRMEYQRIEESWRSLIPECQTTLKGRIVCVRDSIIPLMIDSFRKADVLADAMLIRGYGRNPTRSYYRQLRFSGRDRVYLGVTIVGLVFIFAL